VSICAGLVVCRRFKESVVLTRYPVPAARLEFWFSRGLEIPEQRSMSKLISNFLAIKNFKTYSSWPCCPYASVSSGYLSN
jgi:hypothetical protein